MPIDVKDPEKSQTDVDNEFKGIVENSLAGLKGLGGGHDQKKAAENEAKQNKKDNTNKKEQEARGKDDPLNQQHQKDKNVGHLSKLAKAAKQGGRGEKMDMTKTLAKRYAMKRLRQALLKKLAATAARAAVANPVGIVILIILLLIIIILMGEPAIGLPDDPNQPKLTITKTGPDEAAIGAELDYQITVAYPGSAEDITITDNLPPETEYISSDPRASCDNGECNNASRVVTWSLKDFLASESGRLNNVNTTLALRLRATANDTHIVNIATGTVIGAGSLPGIEPISEGYISPEPASNNCDGKYDFSKYPEENPLGNYGDPLCNFSKDNLYALLQSKESNPEFVDIWFNVIVPAESGYSPQAWAPPVGQQLELDAGGAWGLYQMGSSAPPGQPPPAPGKNGELDRGDVNWEVQTDNAYKYWLTRTNCNFWSYWGSYRKAGLPNTNHC